jgi:hypothetical protein
MKLGGQGLNTSIVVAVCDSLLGYVRKVEGKGPR